MDINQPLTSTSPARTARLRRTRAALVGLALAAGALTMTGCTALDDATTAVSGVRDAVGSATSAAQEAREHAQEIDEALGTDVTGQLDEYAAEEQTGGEGLSADEFCQLLRDNQAAMEAGGPGLAQIILLGEVTNAYEERGALAGLQGSTLDDLAASCPADRDAAYGAADISSFTAI